jgi:S-DNA-T family DNA segregation ATPase FtsK/SpoIIIE
LRFERAPVLAEPDPPDLPDPIDIVEDMPVSGRDAAFDRVTDHTSHEIARRFAPASAGGVSGPSAGPTAPVPDDPRPPPVAAEPTPRGTVACVRPPLGLLRRSPTVKAAALVSQAELRSQAQLLGEVLTDFGVRGEIKDVHPGPVVALYEFEPARGVKSARVTNLADDLARSMGVACVRAAAIPGRNAIGIELPNQRREKVLLRELLDSDAFRTNEARLPLVLGKSISGAPVFSDLTRMPHLLVAGTTGSGKSVGVNAMILSLLYRLPPEQCRFLMIDPKMLELSVYNGIPHLLCPVVTDPAKAVAALNWIVGEMEQRYRRMSCLAVRNIEAFNNRLRQTQKFAAATEFDPDPMPYIVVVVDEFADLMLVAGKEIDAAIQRLAQMARAAGIHIVMATQRPSVDIVTGTIKANFPTRISYKVASKFDSRTIINEQGAEQLLGEGDMLFSNGAGRTMRVHGPFVSDEEVERVAAYLRDQGEPRYVDGITDVPRPDEETDAGDRRAGPAASELYQRAVDIVLRERKASTSYLQRRLTIGYNRAADLIERMEREGIVSEAGFRGRRQVLLEAGAIRAEQW